MSPASPLHSYSLALVDYGRRFHLHLSYWIITSGCTVREARGLPGYPLHLLPSQLGQYWLQVFVAYTKVAYPLTIRAEVQELSDWARILVFVASSLLVLAVAPFRERWVSRPAPGPNLPA